jgi:hypothetical protein
MKNLFLFILLSVVVCANAYIPTVVVHRASGCGITGCNTVIENKTLMQYTDDANVTHYYWAKSIDCSGTNISTCPRNIVLLSSEVHWVDQIANNMLNYAYTAYDNGDLTDSYAQNYQEIGSNITFRFEVTWTDNGNGNVTVDVTMLEL